MRSCIGFNVFYSGNALDGRMDLGLTCYPSGFSKEGADGGSCADAAPTGPVFYGGVAIPVKICSSDAMRGANRCRWEMYAASSRSLMVRNLVGLASVRMWHVWQLTFSTAIHTHILTDTNPTGFLTINDLELAAYIAHLHLFAPCMAPLKHIYIGVDNTTA